MKSSKSWKSSKPQRKRREAADTVEAEEGIVAIAVVDGVLVDAVAEEGEGAARRRRGRGELYAFT
jgi:hypothetical protein